MSSSFASLEAWRRNHVRMERGTRTVSTIRHSEIQSRIAGIGMSATLAARAFGILAGLLNVAKRDRRILANPGRGARLPRKAAGRTRRFLTHHELWAVAEASGRSALL